MQSLLSLIYLGVYVWVWNLFLEYEQFAFLEPWIKVWIVCAILGFFCAKFKKQFPFLGVFVGSVFGPLGVLMVCFSKKDIRVIDPNIEKNREFYEGILKDFEKIHHQIFIFAKRHKSFLRFRRNDPVLFRIQYYEEYFKLSLGLNRWIDEAVPSEYFEGLKKLYEALNAECLRQLGHILPESEAWLGNYSEERKRLFNICGYPYIEEENNDG